MENNIDTTIYFVSCLKKISPNMIWSDSIFKSLQSNVFFSRSFSCQIGSFSNENGVHFAIIKF